MVSYVSATPCFVSIDHELKLPCRMGNVEVLPDPDDQPVLHLHPHAVLVLVGLPPTKNAVARIVKRAAARKRHHADRFTHGYSDQSAQVWSRGGALLATTHQIVYFKA
ncbi:hypothetical protein BN1232_03258 [Mycobacterium lentiflavum]|uniref:Uncharacterized protein n=1 Tax=Mycobacterium lentiflavum TaxID=141349 RepID=A0A0E4GYC3_MYCLN|nr:hypothetical protein BN1232_03258 [Mycobacterium lentiflavum]